LQKYFEIAFVDELLKNIYLFDFKLNLISFNLLRSFFRFQ